MSARGPVPLSRGVLAAVLFGLSAPVAKVLLGRVSPLLLAGLLYGGAVLGLGGYRLFKGPSPEAKLTRQDVPLLAAISLLGVLGPVLMLTGLRRVSALSGSLLLNLEAPFTILLAVLFFREHLGRLAAFAALAIIGGGVLLGYEEGVLSGTPSGFLLIATACLCWGLDNDFTQRLALKDPFAIVRVKAGVAVLTNIGLALALGGFDLPAWPVVAAALVLGALSYGASIERGSGSPLHG